jgi:hypothetical protein
MTPRNTSFSVRNRRQRWMANFETAILALRPELAGKIDFENTGTYFFNSGFSASDAAERYLVNIPVQP